MKFSLRETDCARGSEVDVAPGALPVTQSFIVLNSPTAQHIIIGEQTVKLFHVAFTGYSDKDFVNCLSIYLVCPVDMWWKFLQV